MALDELKEMITDEVQSGLYTLQSIFDRHLDSIDDLHNSGITHKKIHAFLEAEFTYKHYINLLARARDKRDRKSRSDRDIQQPSTNAITPKATDNKEANTPPLTEQTNSRPNSEWHNVGVRKPYLIKKLTELKITPEQVKNWNCSNEMQIIKRATEQNKRNK